MLNDICWQPASHSHVHQFIFRISCEHEAIQQPNGKDSVIATIGLHQVSDDDMFGAIFNGDGTNQFMGLSRFYNTLHKDAAKNAVQVIDGGGNGGTSIYLIGWGENKVYIAQSGSMRALIPMDWRYAARICNVGLNTDIPEAMARAVYSFPLIEENTFFYMNEQTWDRIKDACHMRYFRMIPIRVVKELRMDEPLVS